MIIEQLANKGGYIIYQSYDHVYSLEAWISEKNIYTPDKDLIKDWKSQVNTIIEEKIKDKDKVKEEGKSNKMNLKDFDESIFDDDETELKKYCKFVMEYNETKAKDDFSKAWNDYGKGSIFKIDKLDEYLSKLLDNSAKDDDAKWVGLFGVTRLLKYSKLEAGKVKDKLAEPVIHKLKQISADSKPDKYGRNADILLKYANSSISQSGFGKLNLILNLSGLMLIKLFY